MMEKMHLLISLSMNVISCGRNFLVVCQCLLALVLSYYRMVLSAHVGLWSWLVYPSLAIGQLVK